MLSHCSDLVGDKNKHYFWLGRLFTGRGKAGDGLVRKPGPAWTCVITRCLSATSLGASTTQEKCYLSKTPDSSYLCNYKPRRKANNAGVLLQNPSCKSRGCLYPSTQKRFLTRAFLFSTFEHTNQGKRLTRCACSTGKQWQGYSCPDRWDTCVIGDRHFFWVLKRNNYGVEAKICIIMPNTKTPRMMSEKVEKKVCTRAV